MSLEREVLKDTSQVVLSCSVLDRVPGCCRFEQGPTELDHLMSAAGSPALG